MPVAPVITAEQVVTAGKGKHKHVVGFQLQFNTPLDAGSATDPANYSVVQQTKHGRSMASHPVAFRAFYNPTTDSVQILLRGRPRFAHGGTIIVNPKAPTAIAQAAHARLSSQDGATPVSTTTIIIVLPGARGVVG